jgi:hypothetical protein
MEKTTMPFRSNPGLLKQVLTIQEGTTNEHEWMRSVAEIGAPFHSGRSHMDSIEGKKEGRV